MGAANVLDVGPAGIAFWRRSRLEQAGFEPAVAEGLACDPRSDIHHLIELVERGCPPELAARILAPLDEGEVGSR